MSTRKTPPDLVDRLGPAQPLQEQIDEALPKRRATKTRPQTEEPPADDEALRPDERQRLPESSEEAYGQEGER